MIRETDFLLRYLAVAPMALAVERSLECNLLSSQPFQRPVLDLGCGDGIFASILFDQPLDVGLDPNARELEVARTRDAYEELLAGFGDQIPKPDASVNTILSNSVLEHIPDLDPVLGEAFRVLKSGGRMYATVPSDRFSTYTFTWQCLASLGLTGLARRYEKHFDRFWQHYHCYDEQGWTKRFEAAGFEVERCVAYASRRICMLDSVGCFLAVPAWFTKKLLNRWILMPSLRRSIARGLHGLLRRHIRCEEPADEAGGLVLLVARKP
jgi:SAM-dependent methyltransferase